MRDATGKGRVDVTYATRNVFAYTAKRMRVVVSTENGEQRRILGDAHLVRMQESAA